MKGSKDWCNVVKVSGFLVLDVELGSLQNKTLQKLSKDLTKV